MNRKFLFLPIFVLSLLFVATVSQADVSVVDIESDIRFSSQAPFNDGPIATGSGSVGDYELIGCAVVDPNDVNSFSAPTPGAWTELDNGQCGGDFTCIGSVWGRFTDSPNSEGVNCNWSESNFVYAGGSMRFSGVDGNDPIIDLACSTGAGTDQATAPSIQTEAGSMVVRIFTFQSLTIPNIMPSTFANLDTSMGQLIQYDSISLNTFQIIASDGVAEFFANAGPTGTDELTFAPNDITTPTNWRACTIALRMGPPPSFARAVPTMSEWGLISFAAFAGIAGFWFLRRRQVTA